jgi:hypothetical protein
VETILCPNKGHFPFYHSMSLPPCLCQSDHLLI